MKAVLNQADFNTLCEKVDIPKSKDYTLEFDYDLIDSKYHVSIKGDHDINKLDELTE